MSHKKCIEIAKQQKLDYIIVLEDDCIPANIFHIHSRSVDGYCANGYQENFMKIVHFSSFAQVL